MGPPRLPRMPTGNPTTTRSGGVTKRRSNEKDKKIDNRLPRLPNSDPLSRMTTTGGESGGTRMSLSAIARRKSTMVGSTPTGRPSTLSTTRLPPLSLSPTKRIAQSDNNAKLERVLGCTNLSQTALAVDQKTGAFAYLAGASVVINRGRRNKEVHLTGPSKNTFSCLAFSPCGQYIATGEFGHSPCVRLFELVDKTTDKFVGAQQREMTGHTFGIVAVKFCPSGSSHLVSVGEHHDQMICVWNWKTGEQIATSKVTAHVHAVAISPDGSTAVTVGLRHVKYWSIGDIKGRGIMGRSAILTTHRNGLFVDVAFMGNNRVLAVTEGGAIVELVDKKIIRTCQLENTKIYAIAVMEHLLLVGCNNGSVESLDFSSGDPVRRSSLCLPHYLTQDVATATTVDDLQNKPSGAKFADVHAICCVPSTSRVTVAYADHSIYSWQEGEGGECRKISSTLAHVGTIHALEMYPSDGPFLPPGSFLTGGADGTLRLWNLYHGGAESTGGTPMKNLLSNDLKKMVILDHNAGLVASKSSTMVPTNDRFEGGVKSLRVSRDGRHCAVGMRNGILMVLDLSSPSMDIIYCEEAQEGDVMCVEYSTPSNDTPFLLACGGRDRLVHLFRPDAHYQHVVTLEDHTSAVVAIKFVNSADGFMMYTCAADKMIIIWKLTNTDPSSLTFDRINTISCPHSISDLHISIDCLSLLAACADRQLRRYSLGGKQMTTVKATTDAAGNGSSSCTRMAIDHSGTFVASICSDRFVYIVEVKSGNPVAVLRGFGDLATSIAFSADQRRLIVASSNGCLYVFRLSERIINRISAARRLFIDSTRTPSPDSVLGSGSETVSEDQPKDSEVDSSHFGSVNSLAIDDDAESGVGSNSSVVVSGRGGGDTINISISESSVVGDTHESTFLIEGTEEREEEEETALSPPPRYQSSKSMSNIRSTAVSAAFMEGGQRAASPRRTRRKWGENGGEMRREEERDDDLSTPFSSSLDGGMKLAPSTLPSNFQPQSRLGAVIRQMDSSSSSSLRPLPSSSPYSTTSYATFTPTSSTTSSSFLPPTSTPSLPLSAPPLPTSSTSRLRENLLARKQAEQYANGNGVSSLQSPPPALSPPSLSAVNGFNRESPERVSLSKRFQLKSAIKEPPRTAWSPSPSSSSSSGSRRTTSSIGVSPTGASAAAITRRQSDLFGGKVNGGFHSPLVNQMEGNPSEVKGMRRSRTMGGGRDGGRSPSRGRRDEDDSFSALRQHIRSRSQSPNQLMMNGMLATSTPNGMNAGYTRKDSESSYPLASRRTPSRSNLRGGEEMRKSSQALDKIAQTRKLRQSTENLTDLDGSSPISRARSIGNLRGGGGLLEIGGGFDIDDARPRLSSPLSRISRNLARSMGQLNGENAVEASPPRVPPSSGLLGAMSQLKKASNPDLADEKQYEEREEFTSPILKPRRGAVQKKVDRYHPRNRGGLGGSRMESGSGESDSNASDASPLHSTYTRKESAGNRSLDGLRLGRRLGDSPRLTTSPSSTTTTTTMRRVPNYLSQKMQQPQELEGPDLGSDESPRSSIMNGNINDWVGQFEGKPNEIRKLAHHIVQCTEEMTMMGNKMMHAKRLIRECDGMDEDDRATLLDAVNNAADALSAQLRGEKSGMEREKERHTIHPLNGQTRLSSASSQSSSFSSSHQLDTNSFVRQYGPDLVALLRNNMAKQN
ncbi:hypothetical protein PFISCL1PPCAC_2338 [Pristionchus fissidentatus]|uniref:WD40 domain-containing protein n=1 Tax=Pristionchus fissidentatus TaxID=1538716 RepID=A0AAV5UUS4_9BILA|nr:hypothetical protein PFISCL1PPCAC_2338 [Pristionchus fissidentatus]